MAAPCSAVGGLHLPGSAELPFDLTQESDSEIEDEDEEESEAESDNNAETGGEDAEDTEYTSESESGSDEDDYEIDEVEDEAAVDHSLDTATFTDFPKLPRELQEFIFNLPMQEARFVRVNFDTSADFADMTIEDEYEFKAFCQVKTSPPIQLSICKATRELALKKYTKICARWFITPFYFDREVDILHFESNLVGLISESNSPGGYMFGLRIKHVSIDPCYKKEKADIKRIFGPGFPRTEDEKLGYELTHTNRRDIGYRVYFTHQTLTSFGYKLETAIIASKSQSIASKVAREVVNRDKNFDFAPRHTELKHGLYLEHLVLKKREPTKCDIAWEEWMKKEHGM
ncbi:hypothetical protein BDZ45DRAFT_727525 [Acephala macrosclerotiorum]|nr:hypothetical protein BDZ45DRAFT_727525 [Acephala macrosclerotiorum]